MGKFEKVLRRVLSGEADANIDFDDLCRLLERLGFDSRVKGSHHTFCHAGLRRPIVVQPGHNGKAKSYQAAQVRVALTELEAQQRLEKENL
jgi:predicted RNA binding protein YcfA (HicA-like mRNA interferase family)